MTKTTTTTTTTMMIAKPRKEHTCRFDNIVSIVEIPSAQTYSDVERQLCWYTSEDYRCFRFTVFLEKHSITKDKNVTEQKKPETSTFDRPVVQPRRSTSPDRDETHKSLPTNLLLYNNNEEEDDDDDDDDNDEPLEEDPARDVEDDTEYQIRKIKKMREKLQQLRERKQNISPKKKLLCRQLSISCPIDPLDTSVRQYIPFPEDDEDLGSELNENLETRAPQEKYHFEHPLFNPTAFPTKPFVEAAETVAGANSNNKTTSVDRILDSALFMVR